MPDDNWYATRCVFEFDNLDDNPVYEERVTLWRAPDFDTAIALAETEAEEYAEDLCAFTGLVQAYHLFEAPGHGAEVFSLMRNSTLSTDDYLTRFFDTGDERQSSTRTPG
ncbi:hypothetical protein [Actinoplanes sp. NPDC026670]|uniref:hypothetical protein n=1 Tax=Actinoplanes sp. NPDC026670 TaxID=3154700 RepID=UPI0033C26655